MRSFFVAAAIASLAADAFSQHQEATTEIQLRQRGELRSLWPLSSKLLAWTTGIPMHLRYEEMSPQQQAVVKSQYENLASNDEPPFPEAGLAPLVRALHQAQSKLLVEGELFLIADVDLNGLPSTVAAYSSPSPQMTRIAAEILMLTRFRAARCAGQPCVQQFPLRLQFKVE